MFSWTRRCRGGQRLARFCKVGIRAAFPSCLPASATLACGQLLRCEFHHAATPEPQKRIEQCLVASAPVIAICSPDQKQGSDVQRLPGLPTRWKASLDAATAGQKAARQTPRRRVRRCRPGDCATGRRQMRPPCLSSHGKRIIAKVVRWQAGARWTGRPFRPPPASAAPAPALRLVIQAPCGPRWTIDEPLALTVLFSCDKKPPATRGAPGIAQSCSATSRRAPARESR